MNQLGNWWHARSSVERLLILIVGVLLLVGTAISIVGACLSNDWPGLLVNLGTGLVGSAITLLLIDLLVGSREKREAQQDQESHLKAELVAKMGSTVRDIAVPATEELRRRGWLYDGTLRGAYLVEANLLRAGLSNADLRGATLNNANLQYADLILANLQGARLDGSNLQGANLLAANLNRASLVSAVLKKSDLREALLPEAELIDADLEGAQLAGTNLRGAYLNGANFQKASLVSADLQGANLRGTNMRGSDLQGATLQGAILTEVEFDDMTVMPDGKKWLPDTDLLAFGISR